MLVLSRKEGQQLKIGENVTLTINRISGNRIAIAIDAPREVRVVRGELAPALELAASGDSSVIADMNQMNVSVASKASI